MVQLKKYKIQVNKSEKWPITVVALTYEGLEPYLTNIEKELIKMKVAQSIVVFDQLAKNGTTNRFHYLVFDGKKFLFDTIKKITGCYDIGCNKSFSNSVIESKIFDVNQTVLFNP